MKTTGRRSLLLLALLAALTNDGFGFSSSTKSRRTVGGWIVAVGEERATISLRATEKENAKDENSNNKNNQFDLFSNNANDVDPKCAAGEGNAKRKTRSDFEQKARKRFATGEELKNLRQDLESFGHNLQWAEAMKDEERIRDLKKAIKEGQNRDPEYIYNKSFQIIAGAKAMQDASKEEKEALVEKWSKLAEAARECLPQFQLEGLFVGSYGDHGQQLVNVTYDHDRNMLIGRKVTGDRNVPRGEISFTANLIPSNSSALDPIRISAGDLPRFPGEGQVSRRNFKDSRMVDGQLILIEENQFSFVWSPTKHHVHFSRPSQETTIRLMRDIMAKEDEIENMRDHVSRCFEMDMTTCLARQQDPDNFEPFRRISTQTELDMVEKSLKQSKASTKRPLSTSGK